MPTIKLLNIFALSTFAILLCSLAPSQTLALSVQSNHLARQIPKHHGIAKKKRGTKKCKPRSSTVSPAPQPTPYDPPTNNPESTTTTPKDDPKPTTSTPKDYPTPSTSTTTKPPDNVPTNTPSGPGKLGIAWAMGNDKRLALIISTKRVKIIHIWDSLIPDAVKQTGIPVSIMLWGTAQDKIDRFVQYAKPGYAKYAYGFNEVNEPSQANVDPATALGVWNKYVKPLAGKGYTLGGPVTTSAPNGFDWMTKFFGMCGGDDCGIVEVPVHWYDVKFEDFKTYINKWAGFGKPIRVTEFACQNFNGGGQPSMDQVWSFTDSAINFMEGDPRILSYAPFGFMDDMYNVAYTNKLFSDGGLSDLGWKYVNGN